MNAKTLEKRLLEDFVNSLLDRYQVFAPIEENGLLHFNRISSGSQVSVDSPRLERSPKDLFFPQCETLFEYRSENDQMIVEETPASETERVLFFVRPCDAKALNLMDRVFASWEPEDTHYLDRRKKSLIVGRACNNPWSTCFCTSFGVGPFGKEGMDLIFEDIGDKYVVEALTERGENLIEKNPIFEDAGNEDLEKLKKISEKSFKTIRFNLDLAGIDKKLKAVYNDSFWDAVSEKCIGCGVCSYLCPVCHCFDVLDEGTAQEGKRIRIWDACQYPLFTLHASGHNPRTSKRERIRQRMMHKFDYFVDNFGELACVGCGRCIRGCPANMDIRDSLKEIMAMEAD